MHELASLLTKLYASEINVSVSSFWDRGWTIQLGDIGNGLKASSDFDNEHLDQAVRWLAEVAFQYYPNSNFAHEYRNRQKLLASFREQNLLAQPPTSFNE